MDEFVIKTQDVSRCFPIRNNADFYALKHVNIAIPKKGLTILKGRSGSGKTTLLNIIGALDRPSSGSVYVNSADITQLSERKIEQLRRYKMGYVFQAVALIPMMNAYENIEYALRLADNDEEQQKLKLLEKKKQWHQRVTDCLSMVGLGSRMYHMPQELSGGEQQRVAIARAIAHKPHIIFADEPTGALDTNMGLTVVKLLKELIEIEGISVVMTTHDPKLMDVGDIVYEIEDGEVINGK